MSVCAGGQADTCASGGVVSAYVDMYNATSNSWTTFPTGLGQARYYLAAASLPSGLVFFAGGSGIGTSVCVCQLRRVFLCCRDLTTTGLLHCCVPLMLLYTACVWGGRVALTRKQGAPTWTLSMKTCSETQEPLSANTVLQAGFLC